MGSFDSSLQKTDTSHGDGFFFQLDSNDIAVVRRTSTNGVDVDEVVPQSAWNLDRLDGQGLSRYTLLSSLTNVFLIVNEMGFGASIELGIVAGNSVVSCHRFDMPASNAGSVRTASLPIRFEITNKTGQNGLTTELRAFACSISSSGGAPKCVRRSCGLRCRARDLSSLATATPVLSVRLKASFARASAAVVGLHLTSTTSVYFEIIQNGALINTNWTSVNDTSLTEYDASATTISGGRVCYCGYASAQETLNVVLPDTLSPLASNIGGICDVYTLNVVALMASGLIWCNFDVAEIA